MDPRTAVLVGAAAVDQRAEDPTVADGPVELMVDAARRAAPAALLERIELVYVPRGMWRLTNPGGAVAAALGAEGARTCIVEIGVLQTTAVAAAARRIAAGEADVVLVAGGEARHRHLSAKRAGVELPPDRDGDAPPDEALHPAAEILADVEIERGLALPVTQYAVVESALRAADGAGVADHRRRLAELWAGFSAVAVANPHAWDRTLHPAEEIEGAPTVAFPYSKLHASQWNVDQAAALVLCSAEAAAASGVPRDQWVFPVAVAESNLMIPLSQRVSLARCPAVAAAGRALEAHTGATPADAEHLDLYSCFPSAVQVQARELGIPLDRTLTLTGGMRFAGGPLNNYVLQSTARAVDVLRAQGGTALVTAISGMLTKQGLSLWSARPPARPFAWLDVTDEAAAITETLPLDPAHTGPATVDGFTVTPEHAIVLASTPEGTRTVAACGDAGVRTAMTTDEWTGRPIVIPTAGTFAC